MGWWDTLVSTVFGALTGADYYAMTQTQINGAWTGIGNAYAWGVAFFLTSILSWLIPLNEITVFMSTCLSIVVGWIGNWMNDPTLGPYITWITGQEFADIMQIISYVIGVFTSWTVFFWCLTVGFWWFCTAMNVRLVVAFYRFFWGSA
jgi:hypothetical protein